MSRIQQRIPREKFHAIVRPMVRTVGSKTVIIRLNEAGKIAIPRQTKIDALMEKLEVICYEQARPRVEDELDRLWNIYFENRLGEAGEKFLELSDGLNALLDDEKMPQDSEKRAEVAKALDAIVEFLQGIDFSADEIEAVFRMRAFSEVMDFFLERQAATP